MSPGSSGTKILRHYVYSFKKDFTNSDYYTWSKQIEVVIIFLDLFEDLFLELDQTMYLLPLFLDMGDWYAYVNFYSVTAAEKAYQAFHHCFPIQGSNCKVAQKKRELLKRGRMLVSLIYIS